MKNDLLTRLLAGLFETFKTKNPKLAALIILLLGAVQYVANQGGVLGVFSLPEWLASGLDVVSWILAALVGSSTFNFLSPEAKARRELNT
jgi:hypothetical protein